MGTSSSRLVSPRQLLQGKVNGTRRHGRQKKRWEDNVKEWTGLSLLHLRGQLKIGQSGERLSWGHLRCPLDCPDYGTSEVKWFYICTGSVISIFDVLSLLALILHLLVGCICSIGDLQSYIGTLLSILMDLI